MSRRTHGTVTVLAALLFISLPAGATTLTGIVPYTAPHGARVVVTGTGLDAAGTTVMFTGSGSSSVPAPIVSRSPALIEVIVPPDAVTGPVAISGGSGSATFTLANDPAFVKVATLAASDNPGISLRNIFDNPSGAFVLLPSGATYIADTLHHQIKYVQANGLVGVSAGNGIPGYLDGPGAQARFTAPQGVAIDVTRGRLYIADTGNNVIRVMTTDGVVSTFAGSRLPEGGDGQGTEASFNRPVGLTIDLDGNVFVADSGNCRIRMITPSGLVRTVLITNINNSDPAIPHVEQHPIPLVTMPPGTPGDCFAVPARGPSPTFPTSLKGWTGVAVSRSGGTIYVADAGSNIIRLIRAATLWTIAGKGTAGHSDGAGGGATFNEPSGIAIDDAGNLFVADTKNNSIRKVTIDTTSVMVSTVAGISSRLSTGGFVDGDPSSAQFKEPAGIDTQGTLYIADSKNDALRIIYQALGITALYPTRGPRAGGNTVRLFGTGFVAGATQVTVGSAAAQTSFVSSTEILVTMPAASAGSVPITVITPAGTDTRSAAYTYLAPPSIASIAPRKGMTAGSQTTTITGTNFVDGGDTTVTIGGTGTTSVSFVSASSLTAVTPSGTAGSADVVVTTPGGTATLSYGFTYFPPPAITSFAPGKGFSGTSVIITGTSFDAEAAGDSVTFNGTVAPVISVTATQIATTVPVNATSGKIGITTPGGTTLSVTDFIVPVLTSIGITPAATSIEVGQTRQYTATGYYHEGSNRDVTTSVTWSSSNTSAVTINAAGLARGIATGSATITASLGPISGTAQLQVITLPPDPVTVAPPIDPTVVTSVYDSTSFLYTGASPIQTGVAPGTIEAKRVAILRGSVITRDGAALSGVKVTIAGHPEFGQTLSRADGKFDLAVNGGGPVTITYAKNGYIPVQRQTTALWHDWIETERVALVAYDGAVTAVDLSAPSVQTARGSLVADDRGVRRAALAFTPGTEALMTLSDGSRVALPLLHVRATEYTVGSNGPRAMPALLPPSSGYTYCVELSADEAVAAGAESVTFTKPVTLYLENFVGFPVGGIVPVGWYERSKQRWIASDNGTVIKIVGVTDGFADLDVTGSGLADGEAALTALGITAEERKNLAGLYAPGQSIWRVRIAHFTPFDLNWPFQIPPDAKPPQQPMPKIIGTTPAGGSCKSNGSILLCESQILGDELSVTGTPFTLNYRSDRMPGRIPHIIVQATGTEVPSSLKRVDVLVSVAGRSMTASLSNQPNQSASLQWDGRDGYGRVVQGKQRLQVKINYVYDAIYSAPFALEAFGAPSTRVLPVIPSGEYALGQTLDLTLNNDSEGESRFLGVWDARGVALGGWSLDVQHVFDVNNKILYLGNGEIEDAHPEGSVLARFAGRGCIPGPSTGDGGPALDAEIGPAKITTGPDGSIYILDNDWVVRRIDPNGVITSVPGGSLIAGGSWFGMAAGTDGSIYVGGYYKVVRIRNGILETIAGTGSYDSAHLGDGGPATSASINPRGIAVTADGTLYIGDSYYRVRRVGTDGTITTIAGNGFPGDSGDGGPATEAQIGQAIGVVANADGSIYISSPYPARVRRVRPDGIIETIAGTGIAAFSGDGGPATSATLDYPRAIAQGADGSIYISSSARIRRVSPDGLISTVAGTGTPLTDPCQQEGGLALDTAIPGNSYAGNITVGADRLLYLASYTNFGHIDRLASSMPELVSGEFLVAGASGAQAYVFASTGRHLRTVDTRTGSTIYTFGYDTQGRLITITDAAGQLTTIERAASGAPASIRAPGGQRTLLAVDSNDFLSSVVDPAGQTTRMSSTAEGLLTSLADARGGTHHFTYDSDGLLIRDSDADGGFQILARSGTAKNYRVTRTTALGRVTTYGVEASGETVQRFVQDALGLRSTTTILRNGTTTTTLPDGTIMTTAEEPNGRFGLNAATGSRQIRTPAGLTRSISEQVTASTAPRRPLELTSETRSLSVGGRTYTETFDAATRTSTASSPAGRQVMTAFDPKHRPLQSIIPGLNSTSFDWDNAGRLITILQGTRRSSFAYDDSHRLAAVTDPIGRTVRFSYDLADRVTSQTLPDGRVIGFTYDANGNVTSVAPPSRPPHGFTFTPVDLTASYTPPGSGPTRYSYNLDKQITTITRPDTTVLSLGYDSGGRLSTLNTPRGAYTHAYDATSGNLVRLTAPDGSALAYTYDGSLLTSESWSGGVAGSVAHSYDNDFRISSEAVNDSSITFTYDADSLLTAAGALTLTRDSQNGLLTGSVLGNVSDSWGYNSFGEPVAYDAVYNAIGGPSPMLSTRYLRDDAGRIGQKTETLLGSPITMAYTYDTAGRLATVTRDGAPVATYSYDPNSNRASKTSSAGTEAATYDSEDRLVTYNGTSYSYTPNGELTGKTDASGTTTYGYDPLGNLQHVVLPGAKQIDYVIDAAGRRIGKKVDGVLVKGWLYSGGLRIVGETDGTGTVVSRFVYGTRSNVPDYMTRGGVTYRVLTDHLGSPRALVDANSGTIAWTNGYDEFGGVAAGNPELIPFGFAGGLYDADTKLVHFGAREYDAETGRWTAKDPILFGGGDTNLYGYTFNDPVNFIDSTGLEVLVGQHPGFFNFAANPANHASIVLRPNNPADFVNDPYFRATGGRQATLGGQLSGGRLVSAPNYLGDNPSGLNDLTHVSCPTGVSDTDFIRRMLSAARRYRNNELYAPFPGLLGYNSNSYVSGVIRAAGSEAPALPGSQPGYGKWLPIP